MKKGDTVQVYCSTHKTTKTIKGVISEFIVFGGTNCIRLVGSNKPYWVNCVDKFSNQSPTAEKK